MKRIGIGVVTLATGLAVLAMASHRGPDRADPAPAPRVERPGPTATPAPDVALRRRATRWTCSVRHARTGNYYKCTERDEKKSCRCAIAKCKHWNPGQQGHCSRSCKCHKS